jgi:hypothetical protein
MFGECYVGGQPPPPATLHFGLKDFTQSMSFFGSYDMKSTMTGTLFDPSPNSMTPIMSAQACEYPARVVKQ